MKKGKNFDCVQMKWDIQQKIEVEYSLMSEEKARKVQMERVQQNSILGPFIRKVREERKAPVPDATHLQGGRRL